MNGMFRQVIILLFLGGVLNIPELRSQDVTTDVLDRLLQSYKIDLQRRVERGEISKREFESFLNEMTRAVHSEKEKLTLPMRTQSEEQAGVQIVSTEETNIEANQNALKGKGEPVAKGIEFLPDKLVYQPYVADPRRPRFSVKWLRGEQGESHIDTAIGGYFPLLDLKRKSAPPDEKAQVAGFAGAWSRWDVKENLDQIGTDFRVGLSLSYGEGPWAIRLQHFHESDHLGDELVIRTSRKRIEYRREDIGLGLSYKPDPQYRLYAEGGYGFFLGDPNKPWRAQVGAEWEGSAWFPLGGRPFAAVDLQTWEESKWDPNVNLQFGVLFWNERQSRSLRFSLDLYRGRDPLGEFLRDKLRYLALGFSLDF
jgi:hypothetical protein